MTDSKASLIIELGFQFGSIPFFNSSIPFPCFSFIPIFDIKRCFKIKKMFSQDQRAFAFNPVWKCKYVRFVWKLYKRAKVLKKG